MTNDVNTLESLNNNNVVIFDIVFVMNKLFKNDEKTFNLHRTLFLTFSNNDKITVLYNCSDNSTNEVIYALKIDKNYLKGFSALLDVFKTKVDKYKIIRIMTDKNTLNLSYNVEKSDKNKKLNSEVYIINKRGFLGLLVNICEIENIEHTQIDILTHTLKTDNFLEKSFYYSDYYDRTLAYRKSLKM